MRAIIKIAITFFSFLFILAGSQNSQAQTIPFAYTEEEVSFKNGSIELKGTLMVPDRQTPVPAIVFLHGSGPHERAGFKPYAEEFAKIGMASLFFDKRGSGSSDGSWVTSSLDDLSEDTLAGIQFLKTQEKIDSGRIGFWGISQAGWVAPIAVAKSEDVAFMIIITGGGASPRESELHSYQFEFEKAGLSEPQKLEARRVLNQYFDYLATGKNRSKLVSTFEKIKKGQLKPLADQLESILPSEENLSNWSWVGSYDPIQDIKKINCPVLLMFGENDTGHPTELAAKQWQKGLAKAKNEEVTIMVFPGAGHGIRVRNKNNDRSRALFADGYAEIQLGWLWLQVLNQD